MKKASLPDITEDTTIITDPEISNLLAGLSPRTIDVKQAPQKVKTDTGEVTKDLMRIDPVYAGSKPSSDPISDNQMYNNFY